jgi:hypothetical protein
MFHSAGSSGSISFGENDEMTYLSCLMPGSAAPVVSSLPQQQMGAPLSPGGTSSRSTSPSSWMFLSNPAPSEMVADLQPGMELPVHAATAHPTSVPSSGCLYCDQCQQASKAPLTATVVPGPVVDEAAYIKQEPLTWLPEEMTTPVCGPAQTDSYAAQSCGYSAFPVSYASSGMEQLPLYVSNGLTGPSSPPSVEIALPLEDDWTAFLMDN